MAASFVGSRTPSPPSGICTPPAPRLGYADDWQPYPAPRKSARISSQQQSQSGNRTPSPSSSAIRRPKTRSPRVVKASANNADVMASPRKKRQLGKSGPAHQDTGDAANAAPSLKGKSLRNAASTSISQATGMLPTPSKTPQKPPSQHNANNIKSFARNLFPSEEEVMPGSQRTRSKKYSGMTLESFTVEDMDDDIEIFTDSQDRIPEKDKSADNPFFGDTTTVPEAPRRRSKRQVHIPGEGYVSTEAAARRKDGLLYNKRGFPVFLKYGETVDDVEEEQDSSCAAASQRPLTRSTVKPRLLFPPKNDDCEIDDEEEAVTDVEDMDREDVEEEPRTPNGADQEPTTPNAPAFAPYSPPDTKSTNRWSKKLADDPSPLKGARHVGPSPFDSWPRTRKNSHPAVPPKRQGDSLASAQTKRSRA